MTRSTIRRISALTVALVTTVGLGAIAAGCGGDDDSKPDSTTSEQAKPAKIAYLTYTFADYQGAMEEGMKATIDPGGGSLTRFTADFDPQKQLKQCADAIQSGRYNAIVLAAVDAASGVPCVTQAKAAGIPVIGLEIPIGEDPDAIKPQVDGVVQSIVNDPASDQEAVAELVTSACEGKNPCEAIAEIANATDHLTVSRLDYLKEKVPNLDVVATIDTNYDPGELGKKLPDALAANPNAAVFISIADFEAQAAVPFVKSAGKLDTIKLIGNGGSRSGAQSVKDGSMFGTVSNWPKQMGDLAGDAAIKAVNGQTIDNPGVDAIKLDEPLLVTKETVDQFKPEWGATQ